MYFTHRMDGVPNILFTCEIKIGFPDFFAAR